MVPAPVFRWGLRRVTAHVSRSILSTLLPACAQAEFRTKELGALPCADGGLWHKATPTPIYLIRLTAPFAPPLPDSLGWRQARVQVSARAPLLN
jgi:hypothetical protein